MGSVGVKIHGVVRGVDLGVAAGECAGAVGVYETLFQKRHEYGKVMNDSVILMFTSRDLMITTYSHEIPKNPKS